MQKKAKSLPRVVKKKLSPRNKLNQQLRNLLGELCDMRKASEKGHCHFISMEKEQIDSLRLEEKNMYYVQGLIIKVKFRNHDLPQLHVYGFWMQIHDFVMQVCPNFGFETTPSESEIAQKIKENRQCFVDGLNRLEWQPVMNASNPTLTGIIQYYSEIIESEKVMPGEETMLNERSETQRMAEEDLSEAGSEEEPVEEDESKEAGSEEEPVQEDEPVEEDESKEADVVSTEMSSNKMSSFRMDAIRCRLKCMRKSASGSNWGDEDVPEPPQLRL